MRIVRALALCITLGPGCGVEEKNPSDVNDADLDRLRIEVLDATSVRVFSLDDVVGEGRAVTVQNITQGPLSEVVASNDGSFEVAVPGTVDHVYGIQSEGAKVLPVVRQPDGSIVRGYGISFAGATGCELQHWSGIIRDSAGDALTTCSLGASTTPEGEVASGPVEPFVLRRDTRVTVVAALTGVDGEPPRFEIDFVDQVPEAFTVPVLAQNPAGQFGPTLMQLGQISPDLPGRIVESLELRSPAGSGLVIADITFSKVDPVEED
jgi:hypothetical protein